MSNDKLTHLDETGAAHMVDVSAKADTSRTAIARSTIKMKPETLKAILDDKLPKGDVIATARLAGIMAAKKTSELIPLCHPLMISSVSIDIQPSGNDTITVEAKVKVSGQTGVEMEALTAASITTLTLYDMAKAIDKGMIIKETKLLFKEGGKSGTFTAA